MCTGRNFEGQLFSGGIIFHGEKSWEFYGIKSRVLVVYIYCIRYSNFIVGFVRQTNWS